MCVEVKSSSITAWALLKMHPTPDRKKRTLMRSLFDVLNLLPTTHTSNHQACVLHPHAHCQSSPTEYRRCCSNNHIISCFLNSLFVCIILSFHLTGWLVLCFAEISVVWYRHTKQHSHCHSVKSAVAVLSLSAVIDTFLFGRKVSLPPSTVISSQQWQSDGNIL